MSLDKDGDFRRILEKSVNPYADVTMVFRQARKLADDHNNEILHSKAITHILHGTEPAPKEMKRSEREAEIIRDFFCSIEDKEVCDAVYDSYYEGKQNSNLVYVYNGITDEARKARVRILVKMLIRKIK